jgi:MSHA biogenesis protein MshO
MRPIRPDRARCCGVTLIELVVAIVLVGIITATTFYFLYPVTQAVDLSTRAELTDAADSALQRIGREARLALPNSIRLDTSTPSTIYLEFLPIRSAGRYRGDAGGVSSGSNCPPDGVAAPAADQLSFDGIVDTCFKTIGTVADVGTITANDFLVFNNYGPGFAGQNAYATSGVLNRRQLSALPGVEASRVRFAFTSATALDRSLHDSPGRRFFVIVGNAGTGLPEPVTYICDTGARTLTRRWGYTMVQTPTSPPTLTGGSTALIANNVTGCNFDYLANVAPQIGLLALRLTLSKAVSNTTESVSLYHAIHVSNVP